MTDAPDPRQRAAQLRLAATRNRRRADQITAAARNPDRHPLPTTWTPGQPWPTLEEATDPMPFLARQPATTHRHADQLRDLADAQDRMAVFITRSADR